MAGQDVCACSTALYARELSHRCANALQQAIAAVHLVRRHGPAHIDAAMARLTAIAEVNSLLGAPTGDTIDLVDAVQEVSDAVARSLATVGVTIAVHGEPLFTTDSRAQAVLMAIAELVSNAIRHGLGPGGGLIAIDVLDDGIVTDVLIEDDGRCRGWSRPGGQGQGIVDGLAASIGGTVSRRTTAMGSASVAMRVPTLAAAASAPAGHA